MPEQDPRLPARQWPLAGEGRRRCARLAERLREYQPARIISSVEPKAQETASLISPYLGVPFEVCEGLHEHDRSQVGFLEKEEFARVVASFFERPEELILGQETASQALARFDKAIESVLSKYPGGNLAVITHGTVITLFTAFHAGVASFPFWQKLGLPSMTVLTAPQFELESVLENII